MRKVAIAVLLALAVTAGLAAKEWHGSMITVEIVAMVTDSGPVTMIDGEVVREILIDEWDLTIVMVCSGGALDTCYGLEHFDRVTIKRFRLHRYDPDSDVFLFTDRVREIK